MVLAIAKQKTRSSCPIEVRRASAGCCSAMSPLGPTPSILSCPGDFRSTPESRHVIERWISSVWAASRLMHRSKQRLHSITSSACRKVPRAVACVERCAVDGRAPRIVFSGLG
jgi:hypothetical protein